MPRLVLVPGAPGLARYLFFAYFLKVQRLDASVARFDQWTVGLS